MIKQLAKAAAIASVALTGLAATPALANDRYQRGDYYEQSYRGDRDGRYDSRYDSRRHDNRHKHYNRGYYANGHDYDRYNDNRYAYPDRNYRYNNSRCRSGSTGTILGAVAGGLLGREVGRGGRYNRGSGTTGLIIGAGAGALVGREIDRNGNCR